jgi:hypothetical protein
MKKGYIYLIIIFLSTALGWTIGFYSNSKEQREIEKVYVDKVLTEVVHDTVKIETPIYIDKTTTESNQDADSLNQPKSDSISLVFEDSTEQIIDEDIIREQLVTSLDVNVEWITNDTIDVSELLNKKAYSFNETIIIEYWQSPLNLTGYELSRNKLKLFGFNHEESISLQVEDEKSELIVRTNSFVLRLPKTNQFKTIDL